MKMKEEIYIFGASNLGKKIFDLAKEYFNILGFIDNDKNKWNTEFCKRRVYSPEILNKCKNKVFIASTFYSDIEEQLLEKGFYNYFVILDKDYFYLYLMLNQFDINKIANEEYEILIDNNVQLYNSNKNILIIREADSILLNELLNNIRLNNLNTCIDVLTRDDKSDYRYANNIFKVDNLFKMGLFFKHTKVYDIINIHYLHSYYYIFADLIRNKCKKLIISIWGSDLYAASRIDREKQKKLIYISDIITFANEKTVEEFLQIFGEELRKKCKVCRFGLTILDEIDMIKENFSIEEIKFELNIPKEKTVVMCCHSASRNDNHLEVIKAMEYLNYDKNNLFLIFPMAYGRDDMSYVEQVENKLSKLHIQYLILKEIVSNEKMAKIRLVTDIFINILNTDQLNGALQESMYTGSVPIVGSWLPYHNLQKQGCKLLEVDKFKELGTMLVYVLENIVYLKYQCQMNKSIIYRISGWKNNIESWKDLYK